MFRSLLQRLGEAMGVIPTSASPSLTEPDQALVDGLNSTQRLLADREERYARSRLEGPLDRAFAGFHLSQLLLESGMLRRCGQVADDTWEHALEGLRLSEGMPAQEVVQLFDAAAFMLTELRTLTEGIGGVRRTLDDLVAMHERFRNRLAVFNAVAVIPLDGPQGAVNPHELLRGRPSALLAALKGRPDEALAIIETALDGWAPQPASGFYLKTRALQARCLNELGERSASRGLLEELIDQCPADLQSLRCEFGNQYAHTYIGSGETKRGIASADEWLALAARSGLALRWTDLMCTRAALLHSSGADDEARACFRSALVGPRESDHLQSWPEASSFPLPSAEWYRLVFVEARRVLRDRDDSLTREIDDVLQRTVPPPVPGRSKYRGRTIPVRLKGDARREQLHAQALQVIDEFETQAKPFVLYFRKFDIIILHRAALLGPGLLEVGLYDVLPESCNMLTIQNSRDAAAYSGDGTVWDRTVPALHLEDDSWAAVAEHLIANALAIVSECLVLSPGVLAELQMIDRLRRHADTLLVLPEGILPTIDGDPLIQGFPNTVRGARLSDVSLTQIPFFARLIERSGSGTETDPTTTPSVP
jgi:hypothetical protein